MTMKETLRIEQHRGETAWEIAYVLSMPTPDFDYDGEGGWTQVDPSEAITTEESLGAAVAHARRWAEGSGYRIVGQPKIDESLRSSSVVVLKLARP
jgi:hypothetical protein